MDKKFFIKNISVAFLANLLSMVVSLIIVFILPKFIGVLEYSYYQLYIFYAGYVGFLGIGWLDGIQLRYGGAYYDKLNKSLIHSEFLLIVLLELFFSICIIIAAIAYSPNTSKEFVYIAVAFCIFIYVPRALLHNILQVTARIKEYSSAIIIEKLIHITITLLGIIISKGSFIWFVCSELLGRTISSFYIFYVCRDIFASKYYPIQKSLRDIKLNISCGLFLMISNVASMLIIGVIRQFIELFWDIEVFGKVSLTLSISNFVLIFINSVALVFFPFLKRCPEDNLTPIYKKIGTIISIILPCLFILFFPLKSFFMMWLPQYASTLKYMAILFPICLFETKMCLLINTYMKTLRLEKTLLAINLTCVLFSCIFSFLTCKILHSLSMTVFLITIVLAIRCIISEIILKKYLDIKIFSKIIFEISICILFIITGLFLNNIGGFVVYSLICLLYCILNKSAIKKIG